MDSGEDYYAILEIKSDASADTIKRSFQRLIKKYHPDKLSTELTRSERIIAMGHYHKVTEAHSILSNQEKKENYDRKHNAESLAQEWPISEVVDLDDMTYDPAKDCYTSPCRCSGLYVVNESDLGQGVEVVCCSSCTLSIQVLYKEEAEDQVMEQETGEHTSTSS